MNKYNEFLWVWVASCILVPLERRLSCHPWMDYLICIVRTGHDIFMERKKVRSSLRRPWCQFVGPSSAIEAVLGRLERAALDFTPQQQLRNNLIQQAVSFITLITPFTMFSLLAQLEKTKSIFLLQRFFFFLRLQSSKNVSCHSLNHVAPHAVVIHMTWWRATCFFVKKALQISWPGEKAFS